MRKRSKFLMAALLGVVASCAVITVNIYFPEKDVKEAYKNLEKELMSPGSGAQDKKSDSSVVGQPESRGEASPRPYPVAFELVTSAYAENTGLA